MIDSLVNAFLSCSHRKLAFPMTVKHDPRVPGSRYGRRTYVTCLDCGTELPYSWDQMRIERAEPAVIAPRIRQLASRFESLRAAFSKGVNLYIRCRITRRGAQGDRTWRIRVGRASEINSAPPRQNAQQGPQKSAPSLLRFNPTSVPPEALNSPSHYRSHRRPETF